MRFSKTLAATMAAVSLGLAACATDTPATRRGAGEFADDAAVTTRVKTALANDVNFGTAMAVNVTTYRGVVQLSGFVDSAEKAARAGDVARNVSGVRSVENNVQVKPKS
jgi:osmotically-inducible protein OsmY